MAGPAGPAASSADISPVLAGPSGVHEAQPVSGPPSQESTDTEAVPSTQHDMKWTRCAVLRLLEKIRIYYSQLTDKFTKSKTVWREVANVLSKDFPEVTANQCNQKWRNWKQQYRKYVDNQGKTGRGKMARPEFFDEITEITGRSHTVHPPHTLDTMVVAGPSVAGESSEAVASAEEPKKKRLKTTSSREQLEDQMEKICEE